MDVFRVLARSTSRPKARTNQPQTRAIPSSGPATSPQLFSDSLSVPSRTQKLSEKSEKTRKRKRGQQTPVAQDEIIATTPAAVQTVARATQDDSKSGDEAVRENRESTSAQHHDLLPLEERKRILRSHKIKITILEWTLEEATQPHRKDKLNGHPDKRSSSEHVYPEPLTSFALLRPHYGISAQLASNLAAQGFITPTEVQLGSLPLLMSSDDDVDLLSVAPTGSGKTLAFLIPIVDDLAKQQRVLGDAPLNGPQALILAPTKELAFQISNETRKLCNGTGVEVLLLRKGSTLDEAFTSSAVVVSTPRTMLNVITGEDGQIAPLPSVRFLVLDEADVLLDALFREQTLSIWNALSNLMLRVSLWSATFGSNIEELATSTISRRREALRKLSPDDAQGYRKILRLVVGLKDSAVPNIRHRLTYAATEPGKLIAMRQLLHPSSNKGHAGSEVLQPRPPFLIFTQTIPRATALHDELLYDIPPEAGGSSRVAILHSDLSDDARDKVMAGFRRGDIWILITTDLLSRGVDFRGINAVINYDVPASAAAYVHRVGRTGRAGREGGVAVTLYTDDDIPYIRSIANVIAASEKLRTKHRGDDTSNMQDWLLKSLPKTTKATRKQLKHRGVDVRRPNAEGKKALRARIGTKSGYEKKLENNKKQAIEASRKKGKHVKKSRPIEESDFEGFED